MESFSTTPGAIQVSWLQANLRAAAVSKASI